jgi:PAS domain S-box-containing protein
LINKTYRINIQCASIKKKIPKHEEILKYKTILDHLPIPIHYWKKEEGDFIFWGYNKANNDLAGGILEDSIGKKASDILIDEPHLIELLEKCYNKKDELKRVLEYKFPNSNKKRHLQANYIFIHPDLVLIATLDITERKSYEKKLKQITKTLENRVNVKTKELERSEKKFKELFMNSPVPMEVIAPDASIRLVNPAFESLTGFNKSEITSQKPPYPWWKDQDINIIAEEFKQAMKQGVQKHEQSFKKKNGEVFWVEITSKPVYEDNDLKYYISNWIDITSRKKIKLKLEKSERKFRDLTEQALIGIAIVQDDHVKFFNRKFAKIFGYKNGEIENWTTFDLIKSIYPEERERISSYIEKRQKGIDDIPNRYETKIIKNSGDIAWVEVFAKSINYEDAHADFISIADITERKITEEKLYNHQEELKTLINDLEEKVQERTEKFKRSEMKYRSLYNNAVEGLAFHRMVYDADNNPVDYIITDVNPSFEELMNNKKKYIVNRPASQVYGMNPPPLLNIYSKVAETAKSEALEYYFLPKDKYFRISVFSFEKGKFITLFEDITKEKKAKIKLRKSKKKFKIAYNKANFYKDLFAHDMNNILQNINSASELVHMFYENQENPQKIRECIKIMQDQVKRGSKLISNVQKISKLDESKNECEKVNLCKMLTQSIEMLKSSSNGKDIDVQINNPYSNKIFVYANNLLEDVFDNLLINAIKHAGKNSVEIRINIQKVQHRKKDHIQMEIIDDGKGIKDPLKENLFDKGYNSGITKSGMGLGLYLVKKIIKSFGGTIDVENRVKDDYRKGTKFVLSIPFAK